MNKKEIATKIIIKVGKEILNSLNKNISGKIKDHKTHVMPEQSIISGEKIILELKKSYPNHNYLTQEFGKENNNSNYTWIINPLAGKNNYLDGRDTFTTEIALQYKNKIKLGLIYFPKKDELFIAELNKGATLNDKPISNSQQNNLENAIITYSTYPGKENETESLDNKIISKIPNIKYFGFKNKEDVDKDFGRGSMGAEFCYLACGRIDGLMRFQQKIWNTASGSLIAKEAGAEFTSLPEGNYIAGNKKLVEKLKTLIN